MRKKPCGDRPHGTLVKQAFERSSGRVAASVADFCASKKSTKKAPAASGAAGSRPPSSTCWMVGKSRSRRKTRASARLVVVW